MLNFRGPIMGYLKSPCGTSYWLSIKTIALNSLVFEKNRVFCIYTHFGDRKTDKRIDRQPDEQHQCVKPPSLSRAAA